MIQKLGGDFIYSRDFDENGVIYFLGTLNTGSFMNPSTDSYSGVTVKMSPLKEGQPSNLTSRQNRCTYTIRQQVSTGEPAFFSIDLSEKWELKPTKYTLKHGYSQDTADSLRNWRFQGSNDGGKHWTTISSHYGDEHLGGDFGTYSWNVTCDQWYRQFRIETINVNSILVICGIEFYGNLRPKKNRDQEKGAVGIGVVSTIGNNERTTRYSVSSNYHNVSTGSPSNSNGTSVTNNNNNNNLSNGNGSIGSNTHHFYHMNTITSNTMNGRNAPGIGVMNHTYQDTNSKMTSETGYSINASSRGNNTGNTSTSTSTSTCVSTSSLSNTSSRPIDLPLPPTPFSPNSRDNNSNNNRRISFNHNNSSNNSCNSNSSTPNRRSSIPKDFMVTAFRNRLSIDEDVHRKPSR